MLGALCGCAGTNVTQAEQYVGVLTSKYCPGQLLGAPPSQYIGTFHLSVAAASANTYALALTLVHQVEISTAASLTIVGNNASTIVFASGMASRPTACPITPTLIVDTAFLTALRNELVMVQVTSGGQPGGQICAPLTQHVNVLVGFINPATVGATTPPAPSAALGLAIFYLSDIGQPLRSATARLGMSYWIVSGYAPGVLFDLVDTSLDGANVTDAVVGALTPTVFTLASVYDYTNSTTVNAHAAFSKTPLTGPGSSSLVLYAWPGPIGEHIPVATLYRVAGSGALGLGGGSKHSAAPARAAPSRLLAALTLLLGAALAHLA